MQACIILRCTSVTSQKKPLKVQCDGTTIGMFLFTQVINLYVAEMGAQPVPRVDRGMGQGIPGKSGGL